MADRYIDNQEIVLYSNNAEKKAKKLVWPLIEKTQPALEYFFGELSAAKSTVETLTSTQHQAVVGTSLGATTKQPLLQRVDEYFGKFNNHLKSHDNAEVLKKDHIPPDGKVSSLGRSASRKLSALSHIASRLSVQSCKVREAAEWKAKADALILDFGSAVELSDTSRTEWHTNTPELQAARASWANVYAACKAQVEAVLRICGKMHLMRVVFYDLAVPSNAKVTEIEEETESLEDVKA